MWKFWGAAVRDFVVGQGTKMGSNKILGCHAWNLSVLEFLMCCLGDRCGSHPDTFHISNSRVHHRSVLAIHHTRSSPNTKTCFHNLTCFFSPQHAHCAYPSRVTVFRRKSCGKREGNQCKETKVRDGITERETKKKKRGK
jgi:hypothetical protein